ncbi:hypothetical protein QFC24_001116 [Naganishia onofrii]|uniref:Uncharacterized protein n=1 Tax=Naganishia onofrii TaxID=1851511 RepID=A0ACC2XX86_9TREE|nr:hypothetical protein QFC24_001116 [Naganishia onofrii]
MVRGFLLRHIYRPTMETLRERTIGEGREASQQQQRLAPPPEAFPITEYSQIQSQLQSQSSQPANSPFTSNPFGDENTVAVRPTSLPRAGSLPPPPPPPTTLFNDLAHALAPHRSDTHADDHPLRERDDDDADTDSLLAPPPEYQEHHQATSSSFVATGVEVEAVPPSYDAAGLPAGSRLEVGGALAAAEKEQSGLQGDQGSGLVPLLQGRVLGTTSEIGTTDEKADLKKAEERERTFPLLHQQQHADYEPLHHPQNRTSNPHAMPHHHHQQQQHHHQQQQDKKENDTEDEEKNHLTDLYSIADALSRAYTSSPRLEAQRYIRSWPSSSRQESSRKESSAYASSVGQLSGGKGEGEGEGGSVRASGDAAAAGSLSLSDTASLIVHSATATATAGHIGGGDKGKEKERERASESSFGSGSEVVMLAGGRMTREDEAELRMIWDQIERAHGYRTFSLSSSSSLLPVPLPCSDSGFRVQMADG